MKKILLFPLIVLIFAGAGCSAEEEDFPIVTEPDKAFETSYAVCEDPMTDERIYRSQFMGDDSGWESYYDKKGKLIEKSGEFGPMLGFETYPNTKVENCIRTTEEYFKSRIQEE